jgi:hypothetical protein
MAFHGMLHAVREAPERDERGWWERPEERSMQAYMPEELQEWQVTRLQQAYAQGRKKIKVSCVSVMVL